MENIPSAVATDETIVGPVVAIYPIIKALRPNSNTTGSELWRNAKRGAAVDAIPPTFPTKINKQTTQCLKTTDLGKALKLAIPIVELRKIVHDVNIVNGLRAVVQKSGETTNDVIGSLVHSVLTDELEEQKMMMALQLPELVLGAGPLRCRVTKSLDSKHVMGSIHDFLKWLQVDKDGKHNDWDNWLREALKESIEQGSRESADSFIMEYHAFNGIATPMGNIKVFERLVRLCVGKSKVADGVADAALSMYSQKLAKDYPELSEFLRGHPRYEDNDLTSPQSHSPFVSQTVKSTTKPIPSVIIMPKKKAALLEPVLEWKEDLGALRSEIPAVKATFRSLLEIEVAAGALPKNTAGAKYSVYPPVRLRALAEAALASVRNAVQVRLNTLTAMTSSSAKRRRDDDKNSDDEEDSDNILKVSEVMADAGVWEPVWKTYMSDLSNRMLQLKCDKSNGAFSARRLQEVHHRLVMPVHKYTKSEDWPLARQAVVETKALYEKRIRELLEDAFVRANLFDGTLGHACTVAASRLACDLRTVAAAPN